MDRTHSGSLKLLFSGMLVAVLATVALTGWAQPAHGGGMGMGHGRFLMAPPERIDRGVDRLLDGVDATDTQRQQIKAIARAAAKDIRAQLEAPGNLREQGKALFTAPTVDEQAVEALRQQTLQQHDAVSRRVTQAMVEVSKVLTAQQREQLARRFEKKHRRGGARHEGEFGGLGALGSMT